MFYTHKKNSGKYRMSTPTNISQYAQDGSHISWNDSLFYKLKTLGNAGGVTTTASLFHIARSPKHDKINKTYYLQATGFNFQNLPVSISGVQATIKMERGGRITDESIQLCYNGSLIGENRATSLLDPVTVYGGPTDTWNIDGLNLSMVQNSSFGITMRYQSHPHWPHRTAPKIISVELQIY